MPETLTIVLAGGRGERLRPLTEERAKPAVPFGAAYRIIDFTLSNCIHSDLRHLLVLTQYKSQSLQRHLRSAWSGFNRDWGEFLEIVPPQQRVGDRWYAGTADAVFQNLYSIEAVGAEQVLILSADHIYSMDYRPLLRDHRESGAAATVACTTAPIELGSEFGVAGIDADRRITSFQEKSPTPAPLPDDPTRCLASMGVYVFQTRHLLQLLLDDGCDDDSRHDFGRNILPAIIARGDARAYVFDESPSGTPAYWRDVGSVDAYYEASLDLLSSPPPLDLYDPSWAVLTKPVQVAPGRLHWSDMNSERAVRSSLLGAGVHITDADVRRSILGAGVCVQPDASVDRSLVFDGTVVGEGAVVRRTIVDKRVVIPPGVQVGVDAQLDRERGFTISPAGVTVIPSGYVFSGADIGRPSRPVAVARPSLQLGRSTHG